MPIYTYECEEHGTCDAFQRGIGPDSHSCPTCGVEMINVIAAPAVINIERGWDEKANLYQRDAYTQSKAQLTNINRTRAERGEPQVAITEEVIQTGAQAIDDSKRHPRKNIEQRQIDRFKAEAEKRKHASSESAP